MKTASKKILSVLLAVLMLAASAVPAFAMSEDAWNAVWESADSQAGLTMFAGGDESERNFTWYTETENTPSVAISENEDMSSAKTFTGTAQAASDGDFANHVTVTGLEADKTYFYQCTSGDYESDVYAFTTISGNEFTALYVTDVHITKDDEDETNVSKTALRFNNLLEEAQKTSGGLDLILSAGDQATSGLECEYKGFGASSIIKSLPVATTIGNHDTKAVEYKNFTNLPNEYEEAYVTSYIGNDYWFVKGDVLFMVLDSNSGSMVDHRNFVEAAVNANHNVKWKVMMFHHDLYGGRIPHRESENAVLRILWAPIADEFGVDLVLLGHSHYYTVTNVMYNNKSVADYSANMIDNPGAIYMVSGSINNPRNDADVSLGENVGFDYLTGDIIYNTLSFTEDAITVNSYTVGNEEPFNSYSIAKSSQTGGHTDNSTPFYSKLVNMLGTIYSFFNNFSVYSKLKDAGVEIGFFEFLKGCVSFGSFSLAE